MAQAPPNGPLTEGGFLHVPNFLVSDAELLNVMHTEPQYQIDDQADILTKSAQYKRATQILMVGSFIEYEQGETYQNYFCNIVARSLTPLSVCMFVLSF